jgi:hypothetical protein
VSVELEEALKQGYKVTHVSEIWHFKNSSTELFKDFITHLSKTKYVSR